MNLQPGLSANQTDRSVKIQALADSLEKFLTTKINELSLEAESNTPDFIMSQFLRSICMKAFHAANEMLNVRFAHNHGLVGVVEINNASPLWIPNGQQPVYTRETVGVASDWETHDDYIIALALAGDETAMHNAAGCGFGRITNGKFVADEPPRRDPAKTAESVDRITTEGLQKVWDRIKAVSPSDDDAVERWVFNNFKYVPKHERQSNEQLNIDKGDEAFELARSIHRSIRAMHDGNCPACGIIRPSTEFEHWVMVGNEKKLNHKCPSCGEYITWQDAEAGLAMFHKYMRRNWERFKKWVADRRNEPVQSHTQPTTMKYDEAKHRIDVAILVTDELIAEPKAFREWCHTELRYKLDEFLAKHGQPPYSAPFTTDVPNCCGDPEKCDTPCGPKDCQHEWITEASTYCKKCGIRPDMVRDSTWKITHHTVFERDGDSYEAYRVFNSELDKTFNCDGKADAEWLANELNWRQRSTSGLGQNYRVAYGSGTEIEPEAVPFVLRLDGEVRDRLHLQACWRAAMAFVEHYRFYSNGNALPTVPAALEKYLQENGRKLHEQVTTQPRAVFHQ